MSSVLRALLAAKKLQKRVDSAPVDYIPWLPMQLAFLRHSSSTPALFRAGNRQGKSTVGCAELIFRARGKHPFKTVQEGPVKLALVCMSMTQSVAIQGVFWDLIGREGNTELVEGTEFNQRTGFRGHNKVIEFKNGSTVTIYSNGQGAGALAGSEFHYILLDEPPSQIVYDECRGRVKNTCGSIGLTLTPINGPPLPWLRALCEGTEADPEPKVVDYHTKLTVESQISPLTGLIRKTTTGVPWDKAFIDNLIKHENPIDAPIRLHGEWESRSIGQYFVTFSKIRHVTDEVPGGLKLYLGIDYAAADREMGMCAVLTGVYTYQDVSGPVQKFILLSEVVVPGTATIKSFADAILRNLDEMGLKWRDLEAVFGDNPVSSKHQRTSNSLLQRAIADRLGLHNQGLKPRLQSVKKGRSTTNDARRSKDDRCRWLYGEITNDNVLIFESCTNAIAAMLEWDFGDSHPRKDILDAFMYGLRDYWRESSRYDKQVPVRFG